MTDLQVEAATPAPVDEGPTGPSAGRTRLGRHVAVLALALLALLPLLGGERLFSADEGALAAQTELLARGDGWWLDHPLPEIDPDGMAFPLHLSDRRDGEGAPFAKHPLYPLLLVPLAQVGGVPAMVLASLAGTLAAASVAALLARRVRPGTEAAALWLVGLASPLFFYGYVLIAHTLGAALAGLAALATVSEGRPRLRTVGVALCIVGAALLRSEAVLFGLGLGLGTGLVAAVRRDRTLIAPAVAAVLGAVGGRVLDTALAGLVAGGASAVNPVAGSADLLASRVAGAVVTWLLPSYDGWGADDLALIGTVVFGVAAVVVARRRPEDGDGVRLLAVLAASCALARLALPAGAVPGLLVAFPALAVGLAALDRDLLRRRVPAVLAAGSVVYALGVLATQYETGGSGEWGGRYFALGLPLMVPLAVGALDTVGSRLDRVTRQVATGALVVVCLAGAGAAALALRAHHDTSQRTVALVAAATDAAPDAVVIVTDGTTGRFAWRTVVDGGDWLLVDDAPRLAEVGERLAAQGRPLVVSTYQPDRYLEALDPWYEVTRVDRPSPDSSRAVYRLQVR